MICTSWHSWTVPSTLRNQCPDSIYPACGWCPLSSFEDYVSNIPTTSVLYRLVFTKLGLPSGAILRQYHHCTPNRRVHHESLDYYTPPSFQAPTLFPLALRMANCRSDISSSLEETPSIADDANVLFFPCFVFVFPWEGPVVIFLTDLTTLRCTRPSPHGKCESRP